MATIETTKHIPRSQVANW